jgi:hypothetical protein
MQGMSVPAVVAGDNFPSDLLMSGQQKPLVASSSSKLPVRPSSKRQALSARAHARANRQRKQPSSNAKNMEPSKPKPQAFHFLAPALSFDTVSASLSAKQKNDNLGRVQAADEKMTLRAKTARNHKRNARTSHLAWSSVTRAIQPYTVVDDRDTDGATTSTSAASGGKNKKKKSAEIKMKLKKKKRAKSAVAHGRASTRGKSLRQLHVEDVISSGRSQFDYHRDWKCAPPTDRGRLWSWNHAQEPGLGPHSAYPDKAAEVLATAASASQDFFKPQDEPNWVWRELAWGALDPRVTAERALLESKHFRYSLQYKRHENNPRTHERRRPATSTPASTSTSGSATPPSPSFSSSSSITNTTTFSGAKQRAQWRKCRDFVLGTSHLKYRTARHSLSASGGSGSMKSGGKKKRSQSAVGASKSGRIDPNLYREDSDEDLQQTKTQQQQHQPVPHVEVVPSVFGSGTTRCRPVTSGTVTVAMRRRMLRASAHRSRLLRTRRQAEHPRYAAPWVSHGSFPIRDQPILHVQTPRAAYDVAEVDSPGEQGKQTAIRLAQVDTETLQRLSKFGFADSRINHKAFAPQEAIKVPSFAV